MTDEWKYRAAIAGIVVFACLSISACVYTLSECGLLKTWAFGDRAIWAALSGMCDD